MSTSAVTTRGDFEKLVELRLGEAKALLDQEKWDGAFYIAGCAVEFALKVRIIARLVQSGRHPSKDETAQFYGHALPKLLKLADLEGEADADQAIGLKWAIIAAWDEQSRYRHGKSRQDATELFDAIGEVLPWIKSRW